MVELSLGLRLVRGPDWCWGDQDGGEGGVGTLVEVGEGGKSALVQWDLGERAWCRCGKDDKFDLRVFDCAPTGDYRISFYTVSLQTARCFSLITKRVCHSEKALYSKLIR